MELGLFARTTPPRWDQSAFTGVALEPRLSAEEDVPNHQPNMTLPARPSSSWEESIWSGLDKGETQPRRGTGLISRQRCIGFPVFLGPAQRRKVLRGTVPQRGLSIGTRSGFGLFFSPVLEVLGAEREDVEVVQRGGRGVQGGFHLSFHQR